jgi:cation-transporting ATPase I
VAGLRAGGAVVAVVSGIEAAALAAADIGVGVGRPGQYPPWSADLICTDDLVDVWRVLRLAPAARSTSARAATLAGSGSALAVLTTLTGARTGLVASSARGGPVQLAAVAAMVEGTVAALRADRAAEPAPVVRGDWHALPTGVALSRLGTVAPSAEPSGGRHPAEPAAGRVPRQRAGVHDGPPVGAAERAPAAAAGELEVGAERPAWSRAAGAAGSLGRAVVADLRDPLVPVLLVGAVASAVLGSGVDAALVAGVSLTNALVSGAQRARAEGVLARLVARHVPLARLVTPGGPAMVAASGLRPGDLVELRPTDVVPADARLIRADRLEIDEATLTGESLPVSKTTDPTPAAAVADRACMVYEGTTVLTGSGTALVVATGASTQAGRARGAAGAVVPAGAQARLRELTRMTLPLTGAAGLAVTALSSLRGASLREALSAGVAVAVAAVPEGLPLVATVSQVAAARRLARQGVLVRSSRTVEALGRLDVICFDKTGTLTEGRLVPRAVMVPGSAGAWRRHPLPTATRLGAAAEDVLRTAAVACPAEADAVVHATDRAVLAAAADLPDRPARPARTDRTDRTDSDRPDRAAPSGDRLAELGFETSRGYAATLTLGAASTAVPGPTATAVRRPAGAAAPERAGSSEPAAAAVTLAVKGAPEVVIDRCALSPAARRAARRAADDLAAGGLRVLAVGRRTIETAGAPGASGGPRGEAGAQARTIADADVRDLRLVGLIGLADRPRESAVPAVRRLSAAGVRVTMVTGDHPATARAIATEIGMPRADDVVTGETLDRLDDDGYQRRIGEAAVFARVSPEQKVRLVRALRRTGRVVAMTGDGTNDAAAIRAADVGVAITGRGAAAAQGAADLLLADPDLDRLAGGLIEGRRMWDAVSDAVSVLVGGNAGEVVFTLIGTAISGTAPLNPRQLLLVNLLTDMAPAMALAVRGPGVTVGGAGAGPDRAERSERPDWAERGDPGNHGDHGAAAAGDGQARLRHTLVARGALTAAGATSAWLLARMTGGARRASTVGLLALVGTQLGQTVVVARRDPLVIATAVGSAALLAGMVQTPAISGLFGSRPVGPVGWGLATGCALGASLLGVAYERGWLDRARPVLELPLRILPSALTLPSSLALPSSLLALPSGLAPTAASAGQA